MYTREDHMSISKVIAFKYFVVKCVCAILALNNWSRDSLL